MHTEACVHATSLLPINWWYLIVMVLQYLVLCLEMSENLYSFFNVFSVPSTIHQTLQQVKPNSTMLPRSSPGMGLGGVKINTSGPPMRLGLSRKVRVKPLHSHVSVQHWYRNLKKFREKLCLFHLHEHLPICQMNS